MCEVILKNLLTREETNEIREQIQPLLTESGPKNQLKHGNSWEIRRHYWRNHFYASDLYVFLNCFRCTYVSTFPDLRLLVVDGKPSVIQESAKVCISAMFPSVLLTEPQQRSIKKSKASVVAFQEIKPRHGVALM